MSSLEEIVAKWAERFWYARGVFAALLLLQIVPSIADISRFEFLRAFHAVVVAWDEVAGAIGRLIGALPFIPEFDSVTVSASLFALSLGLPSAYYLYQSNWTTRALDYAWQTNIIAHSEAIKSRRIHITSMFSAICIFLSFFYFYARPRPFDDDWSSVAMFWFNIAFMFLAFALAVWKLKGYGRGLVTVVIFVVTMQLLYWLNTPWLTQQINDFSQRATISEPQARASPDT